MAHFTNSATWELPFGPTPQLELHAEFGQLTIVPVEPGGTPRLELSRGSTDTVQVHLETDEQRVRVSLEPFHGFHLFGGWECRATVFVPRDVRAHVQTNAGTVSVRELEGCELGIKANAGKIDLAAVHGVLHLGADAGSVVGHDVGGYLNVETQAGSVRLGISDLQPGEHRIRATMGSVRLELAHGLDVCIETHASMGSVRTSFPSRQAAPARLVLKTDMGELRIDESGNLAARPQRPPTPVPPPAPTPPSPPPSPSQAPAPSSEPSSAAPGREAAAVETAGDPEVERILRMVEAGELSAQDADELLQAMGQG